MRGFFRPLKIGTVFLFVLAMISVPLLVEAMDWELHEVGLHISYHLNRAREALRHREIALEEKCQRLDHLRSAVQDLEQLYLNRSRGDNWIFLPEATKRSVASLITAGETIQQYCPLQTRTQGGATVRRSPLSLDALNSRGLWGDLEQMERDVTAVINFAENSFSRGTPGL